MSTSNEIDILSDDELTFSTSPPTLLDSFQDLDDKDNADNQDNVDNKDDVDNEDSVQDVDDVDDVDDEDDDDDEDDVDDTNVSAIKEKNSYIKNLVDDLDLKIIEHDTCVKNFEKKGPLGLFNVFIQSNYIKLCLWKWTREKMLKKIFDLAHIHDSSNT